MLSLLLFMSCGFNKKHEGVIIFKSDIAEDATSAVLSKFLETNDNSITEIKFEKGTYHFYPEKALEKFCHISNHGDLMIRTAFPIKDYSNLTIDGQGATFIFHGIMIPFLIEDSKNITVKNVIIDWADPFCSEGLIVANNEKEGTFDMQISDEYTYDIRNGQLYYLKEYYEHTLGQTILYDPERKAIAFQTEAYTPLSSWKSSTARFNKNRIQYKYGIDYRAPEYRFIGTEYKLFVEELEPGLVRIHNHSRKKLPRVGTILSSKGDQEVNRVAPAFRLTHTYGFNALNVTVHHAGGMGIIAENSADILLDSFNVTPSNGRMVSTTADATHFVGCRGKVELKNCTLQNQLDDAMNVHGVYQIIVDILDDHRIGVRMGHHQQLGFSIGIPGDSLGLVRLSDSFDPYDGLTINNIEYVNDRYQIITLNEELPDNLQEGDFVENLSAYPEVLVENCIIANNRARGLLISTPKETIVKDNFFSTEMEAILVPVESSFWYESGNGSNITIINNVFQDCVHSGQDRGVIRFQTDDNNKNIAFRNIKISDNTFSHFDNWILEVSNLDGLTFSGNTITNSGTFPQLFPTRPAIKIKASKNVVFKNNTYKGNAKVTLETDDDMILTDF
jgi:hypothetical protein